MTSEMQRDIERIEPLIPFDPETRGAWQRIRTRIAEAQDDASEESQFLNHYRCPSCQHEWDNQWSATCDDECPNCGASNISPWRSEDL